MNKGVVSVLVAYLIWGLYPFYFHAMQHVAPAEIVIHRVLWTFALLAVYLFCSRRWRWIQKAVTDRRTVAVFDVFGAHHCQLVNLYLCDRYEPNAGGFARIFYESLGFCTAGNSISERETK